MKERKAENIYVQYVFYLVGNELKKLGYLVNTINVNALR